jgi:hypothetical protein
MDTGTEELIDTQSVLDDTQPIKSLSHTKNRRWRRLLFVISSVIFASIIVLLALPTLFFPPSELASPYELFSLAQVSEELNPDIDHLVTALDGDVELYIPVGVELGAGSLVILPRQDDFVPQRVEEAEFRKFAVDIFLVRPNGDLVNSIAFDQSMLLCFTLDAQDQKDREDNIAKYNVQRFEEDQAMAGWTSLDPVPGWREDQACGSLSHLSLYALGVVPSLPETIVPEPKDLSITPTTTPTIGIELDGLAPYGFPTETVTP